MEIVHQINNVEHMTEKS